MPQREWDDQPDPRDPGVDPRFLLASERTYLAWVRTALALVAGGLAVIQFVQPQQLPAGRLLVGVPMVALGGGIAAGAYRRSRAVERALRAHRDLPRSRLPLLLAVGLGVGGIVAAFLALLGR